jgi:tetratricopeptide (TPR) repeat protein
MRSGMLALCLLAFPAAFGLSQSYRSTVNSGNDSYKQKKYDDAGKAYDKAGAIDQKRIESRFNHGNALYRAGDPQGALKKYQEALEKNPGRDEAAGIAYNIGNTWMSVASSAKDGAGEDAQMKAYQEAINAYKQSLKLKPDDEDTRYNLAYAMRKYQMLQKQKEEQKKDKKDKKDDKKKDDQKKNDKQKDKSDNKQDQKKDQNQQQQQQQNKDQQNKDQKQQQRRVPKQQSEQMLRALERNEKDLQKRKRAAHPVDVRVEKDW